MSALALRASQPAPQPGRTTGPRLRIVAPQRRARRYSAAIALLGALAVFGCVTLNALAAEQAFAAREAQDDVEELTLRYDELTLDVARLESPQRIRQVAVERLGMVAPAQPGFLHLDDPSPDDRIAGDRQETARR